LATTPAGTVEKDDQTSGKNYIGSRGRLSPLAGMTVDRGGEDKQATRKGKLRIHRIKLGVLVASQ